MEKTTLIKLGLGALGTGSVATPSTIAVQRSIEVSRLRDQMANENDQALLKRAEEADETSKNLVDEINRYKDETQTYSNKYYDEKRKNSTLSKKLQGLEAKASQQAKELANQRKYFEDALKKLREKK